MPQIVDAVFNRLFASKALSINKTWTERETPEYPAYTFSNFVHQGFRKNELINGCIIATSDSTAQLALRVHDTRSGQVLPDHPLAKLIQRPNPFMSEFDFWTAVIVLQYLGGKASFEKERNRRGEVVGLWPLRPDWMKTVWDQKSVIAGYWYGPPGERLIFLPADDVLDFPLFDPINFYQGFSPVSVAARTGAVDNAITDYIKLFFEKGGTPSGMLVSKIKMNSNRVKEVRARWREQYGGMANWMDPIVLDVDAIYQRLGLTFEEMGFEKLDARNEARVCMVLRVPPVIVGAKIGLDAATYSNYEVAEKAWWRNRLIPLFISFKNVMSNSLLSEFPGNVELRWDMSEVYVIQEDQQRRWSRMNEALRTGGITVNEYREEVGLDKDAGGDVYIRSLAMVDVPLHLKPPKDDPRRSMGGAEDETASEDDPEIGGDDEDAGDKPPEKSLPSRHKHDHKRLGPPDRGDRNHSEAELRARLIAYFEDQKGRLEEAIKDTPYAKSRLLAQRDGDFIQDPLPSGEEADAPVGSNGDGDGRDHGGGNL